MRLYLITLTVMSLHRFSMKVILLTVTPPAAAARATKPVVIQCLNGVE